jgi:PKD repeat protein
MIKIFLFLFFVFSITEVVPFEKKSIVERFTNCSCGPCAQINNQWYNTTTAGLLASGDITHVIYNVDWPSPTDPMHLFNAADNNTRRGYYGVNAVPWIEINGVNTSTSQGAVVNAVTNGNAQFAPFKITLTPERFSNDVLNVHVKIERDPADVTVFNDPRLRLAITENYVPRTCITCCNNGETEFFNVTRKMLPDAKGTSFEVPAPGGSIEFDFLFIPDSEFLNEVNLDSLTAVAFIQDDQNKVVYQSEDDDFVLTDRVNAAFHVEENMGAAPFNVTFHDYSTATGSTSLTSWAWDFDNDGTIDSNEPNPAFTYTSAGNYTVSLTVSDGQTQHTRTIENFVYAISSGSHILVVNGIEYRTYPAEFENFYNNSAGFGNHEVDVWDLFGDQGFDYSANPNIQEVNLFNRDIPNSVLNLYDNVIWFGNNFGGDIAFYNPQQILDFIQNGGSFLISTRQGLDYLSVDMRQYVGITQISGLIDLVNPLIALDDSLVNMPVLPTNTRNQFVVLDPASEALAIFDDDTSTVWTAGFRIRKADHGAFIYIAGRPYRFDNQASFQNYDFIINKWMNPPRAPSGSDNFTNIEKPAAYHLYSNYPNPFNPVTTIRYAIAERNFVTLKVYDILGTEVASLVEAEKEPGIYSISFSADKLASGVYIYKLQAGNFISSKKMILMK